MNPNNITIGYLYNPDVVYFNEMDDRLIKLLEENGSEVIKLRIEEINFCVKFGVIEIFKNSEKVKIDGFLSYGHMSNFHYEAYTHITSTLTSMGIPCLHHPEAEKILVNKYLQALCYNKNNVPHPLTTIGFSIGSFKNLGKTFFPNFSILKKLDDYGGDGVILSRNKDNLINTASKLMWKNEYCLFQEFINDSKGRSVRVLCIGGKAQGCLAYVDKTDNFLSNSSYGFDFYNLESLMENPKLAEYSKLAENAVAAIGDLTIGGVDILDSKEKGLVVLEVNAWPDLYDISYCLNVDFLKRFIDCFYNKVLKYKNM